MDRFSIALVVGGVSIDGGSTRAVDILYHVGRHAQSPRLFDKPVGVVSLVSTDRFLVHTSQISGHLLCRFPLAVAIGQCHSAIHDQVVAIVHQDVASVARKG